MTARAFAALVRVELREVLPLWLGAMGLPIIATVGEVRWLQGVGTSVCLVAQVALAALVFGHDHRHRTLDTLLVQPVSRRALLLVKLVVLVTALAGLLLFWSATSVAAVRIGRDLFWLSTVCALCLAPWLTLVTRSELAGMVFGGGVPAMLWIGAQVVAMATYGLSSSQAPLVEDLREALFAPAFGLALVTGAIGTVVTFLRLEAPGPDAPRALNWLSSSRQYAAPRRPNRYWALALKEIRLQRLALAVAGLFTLLWVTLATAPVSVEDRANLEALQVTLLVLYAATMLFLVSSVTSAEERQLGVLAAQILQPLSVVRQWAVKVGTAAALALLLIVVLPWSLDAVGFGLAAGSERARFGVRLDLGAWFVAGAVFTVSVYVSSLSRRGLTALLGALFVMGTLTVLMATFDFHAMRMRYWLARQFYEFSWVPAWEPRGRWWLYQGTIESIGVALGLVLAVVTLRYAMKNYGSLEGPARVLPRQLGMLAAALLLGLAVVTLLRAPIDAGVTKAIDQMRRSQATRPPR